MMESLNQAHPTKIESNIRIRSQSNDDSNNLSATNDHSSSHIETSNKDLEPKDSNSIVGNKTIEVSKVDVSEIAYSSMNRIEIPNDCIPTTSLNGIVGTQNEENEIESISLKKEIDKSVEIVSHQAETMLKNEIPQFSINKTEENQIRSMVEVNDTYALCSNNGNDLHNVSKNKSTETQIDELSKKDDCVVNVSTPTHSLEKHTAFKISESLDNENENLCIDKTIYTISDDDDNVNGEKNLTFATNEVENAENRNTHIENDVINLDDDDELTADNAKFSKRDTLKQQIVLNIRKDTNKNNVKKSEGEKNHRLLYKFEIDDSSQESCIYKVPRDDVEDDVSNDTFASSNEEDESRNEHGLESMSRFTSNESQKLSQAKCVKKSALSNMNGSYKLISKQDNNVIVQNRSLSCDNEVSKVDIESQSAPELLSQSINQSLISVEKPDHTVTEDDASRCSSLASFVSSSTSSRNHLVIDHRIDESEAINSTKLYEQPQDAYDDVTSLEHPLKINLKRKLSETNVENTKRMYYNEHSSINTAISSSNVEQSTKEFKCENILDSSVSELSNTIQELQTSKQTLLSPPNTLLLQHLEPAFKTAPLLQLNDCNNIRPLQSTNNTSQLLCFKCKNDSFNNSLELYKHLQTCKDAVRSMECASTTLKRNGTTLLASNPSDLITFPALKSSLGVISGNDVDAKSSHGSEHLRIHNTRNEPSQKKRYYKCMGCGTYHEFWHFFLHVREKHGLFMCFYCIRFYPTAEKLSLHLEIKHDLEQNHYNSEHALRQCIPLQKDVFGNTVPNETCFLMCCTCQHVFNDTEPFTDHLCADHIRSCLFCGQKGRHSNQCKVRSDGKRFLTRVKKKCRVFNISQTTPEISLPQSSYHSLPVNVASSNCDNNADVLKTFTTTPTAVTSTDIIKHNEYNNIKSNIYDDGGKNSDMKDVTLISNYLELSEHEQMNQTSLKPENECTAIKLVVPKFKLRVPKEFQKSVDAALSSTESEDDDEIEDHLINDNRLRSEDVTKNIDTNDLISSRKHLITPTAAELPPSVDEAVITQGVVVDEEDTLDDQNSNLIRIMQEIERTKLDIKRTKAMRQTTKYTTGNTSVAVDNKNTLNEENVTNENTHRGKKNWSPTPPASPHSRHSQMEVSTEPKNIPEVINELHSNRVLERRETVGSDAMDIDETITSNQVQIMAKSENVILDHSTISANKTEINNWLSIDNIEDHVNTSDSNLKCVDSEREVQNCDDNATLNNLTKNESTNDNIVNNEEHLLPADGIAVANEDTQIVDLQLDRALEKYEVVDFVRICLKAVYPLCLYCNHARRIAVNGESLVLHMIAQHRFSATVDSITAEELMPETITKKLKSFLSVLEHEYFNANSYSSIGDGSYSIALNERVFECFQCRFIAATHKELYLHNRKMHLRTAILCFMCRTNFYSFSEILCHMCPGAPFKSSAFDVAYRCCLCAIDKIPSSFRLMVHLRRQHCACDVCLEDCRDQSRLSSHVWKHKLHHVCYRCGIAYRNKMDITKHLFWKHGTESIICKQCMQKRWRHVYHFCVPPNNFVCEVCNLSFSRAMYLKVHKRIHTGDQRYPCTEENCDEKFISRKLLLKHATHHQPTPPPVQLINEDPITMVSNKISVDCGELDVQEVPVADNNEMKLLQVMNVKIEGLENEAKNSVDANTSFKNESTDVCDANYFKTESVIEKINIKEGVDDNLLQLKLTEKLHKKRKKNKRAKVSLDDLNLTAPNLSESDSSGISDGENKSKDGNELSVPNIMLSPLSEAEGNESNTAVTTQNSPMVTDLTNSNAIDSGNVLKIWKNLLQVQQDEEDVGDNSTKQIEDCPKKLHVVCSDHDYCAIKWTSTPVTINQLTPKNNMYTKKSPGHHSGESSATTDGDSTSDSDSSCSCGSNCSCSSSDSNSSSSSNSSDVSDSSADSNMSRVKRHRKKSERDRIRKKSQSASPAKRHNCMESLLPNDNKLENVKQPTDDPQHSPTTIKDTNLNESDLETAESDTDEDFYDNHPQKLASEMLAQKRAQLMAQTLLSPSHNFDIVENSRPSTPSLPDDVAVSVGKLLKQKKKKKERKSTSKLNLKFKNQSSMSAEQAQDGNGNTIKSMFNADPYTVLQSDLCNNVSATAPATLSIQHSIASRSMLTHLPSRISEGSSCSDVDGSLKRSKRTRRPNKFYGYTSDDDNIAMGSGQSLIIGARAIKPTPPPQLTWHKEDLPTPSRSIFNNKSRKPRKPKSLSDAANNTGTILKSPSKRKRQGLTNNISRKARKKHTIKHFNDSSLPPIPTLKIRPQQISTIGSIDNQHLNKSDGQCDDDDEDEEEEEDDAESSESNSDNEQQQLNATELWRTALQYHATMPITGSSIVLPQPVPTPQTTAFNHKIPPALLPNPDFATLQYFKANNIRYPIRPPAGARQARDGESVYCYCRCPYDEVSEMIACDGDNCLIEWFHFECVGIMVAPQGKWFCAECRPQYSEELYPTATHSIKSNTVIPDVATSGSSNTFAQSNVNDNGDS